MTLRPLDWLYGVAAVVLAVGYTAFLVGESVTLIDVGYATISWAFVPAVLLWRKFPLAAPVAIMVLLGLWCVLWLVALPLNTCVSPWLLTVLLAVYAPARYSGVGSVQGPRAAGFSGAARAVLILALIGSFVSPVMWRLGPDLLLEYRSGTDFVVTLAAHWGVVAVTYLVARQRYIRQLQRAEQEQAAREIHDVLAHSLTLIKVQANAGLVAGQERDALEQIKKSSSVALEEVRGVVGKLRGVQPAAQLAHLPELIQRSQSAGLTVQADLADVPVAPATERAIYRIVAEALTNALRHQQDASVQVTVAAAGEFVEVTVASTGAMQPDRSGTGTGLVGSQERARSLGGDLTYAVDGDTFRVHATLKRFP